MIYGISDLIKSLNFEIGKRQNAFTHYSVGHLSSCIYNVCRLSSCIYNICRLIITNWCLYLNVFFHFVESGISVSKCLNSVCSKYNVKVFFLIFVGDSFSLSNSRYNIKIAISVFVDDSFSLAKLQLFYV